MGCGDIYNIDPRVFSKLYCAMVRSGEAGGMLDVILSRLADFAEQDAEVRGKIKSARITALPYAITCIACAEKREAAEGEEGWGRMVEPEMIVAHLGRMLERESPWRDRRVVVTAGPTFEDIDPVRFIGNRSSGRMGFAVAAAAAEAGARVSLVAGPVRLETPPGVERVDVRSAAEMHAAALRLARLADVFFGVAAVADYRPAAAAEHKIKKGPPELSLRLVGTADIVAEVAGLPDGPLTIGFAAETEGLREHALQKLSDKGLDMIAANRVGVDGSGFDSENNDILLLSADREVPLGKGSKIELARLLMREVASLLKDER